MTKLPENLPRRSLIILIWRSKCFRIYLILAPQPVFLIFLGNFCNCYSEEHSEFLQKLNYFRNSWEIVSVRRNKVPTKIFIFCCANSKTAKGFDSFLIRRSKGFASNLRGNTFFTITHFQG